MPYSPSQQKHKQTHKQTETFTFPEITCLKTMPENENTMNVIMFFHIYRCLLSLNLYAADSQ